MSLKIQDEGTPPVEGWQYPVKATGHTVSVMNGDFSKLVRDVTTHCQANSVTVPDLQEIIDWVCKHLHARCYDDTTRQPLVNKLTLGVPHVPKGCCGQKKK